MYIIFTHKLSFTKKDYILIFQFYSRSISLVRVFHKLLEIFQSLKVALKKNPKMLFITKAAQNLLGKTKPFFWSCANIRDRGARRKVGGLTIENNFFILKIEKRNKIIVFDLFLSRDFAYFIQYLLLFIGRH